MSSVLALLLNLELRLQLLLVGLKEAGGDERVGNVLEAGPGVGFGALRKLAVDDGILELVEG